MCSAPRARETNANTPCFCFFTLLFLLGNPPLEMWEDDAGTQVRQFFCAFDILPIDCLFHLFFSLSPPQIDWIPKRGKEKSGKTHGDSKNKHPSCTQIEPELHRTPPEPLAKRSLQLQTLGSSVEKALLSVAATRGRHVEVRIAEVDVGKGLPMMGHDETVHALLLAYLGSRCRCRKSLRCRRRRWPRRTPWWSRRGRSRTAAGGKREREKGLA